MIAAGFRKRRPSRKKTPLEQLYDLWEKLSNEDRARFLVEMLTPVERRLVASGVWPTEGEEP
jgi:hypothetical protein